MYIDHLKKMRKTPKGLTIFVERLQFGIATRDDGKRGLMLIGEVMGIEFVHVIESRETLVELRKAIDTLLGERGIEIV